VDYSPPEDERGVDIAQIRERLRLTPAERFQRLVDEARILLALQGRARAG
jgi:hypothetical protein